MTKLKQVALADERCACLRTGRRSMASFRRRHAQRADRHDDPQPYVGAVGIAPAPHLVHLLPRLRCGLVAVLLDQQVRGAGDVEIGWGVRYSITSSARADRAGGTSRPSALAVFRLITNSYLVAA